MFIAYIKTATNVRVDSVSGDEWYDGEAGTALTETVAGVAITHAVAPTTFIPWSNIRFVVYK